MMVIFSNSNPIVKIKPSAVEKQHHKQHRNINRRASSSIYTNTF